MLLNSKSFDFSFFLSARKQVNNLEDGARQNGGATKFNDAVYSNYSKDDYIRLNDTNNSISIIIPSTINVSEYINNREYVLKYNSLIQSRYNNNDTIYYNTQGSWLDEDTNNVVIENVTIITINLNKVTASDIRFFNNLALQVKKEMNQQGVSILINDCLCIA